jgi:hypothetical protein
MEIGYLDTLDINGINPNIDFLDFVHNYILSYNISTHHPNVGPEQNRSV